MQARRYSRALTSGSSLIESVRGELLHEDRIGWGGIEKDLRVPGAESDEVRPHVAQHTLRRHDA